MPSKHRGRLGGHQGKPAHQSPATFWITSSWSRASYTSNQSASRVIVVGSPLNPHDFRLPFLGHRGLDDIRLSFGTWMEQTCIFGIIRIRIHLAFVCFFLLVSTDKLLALLASPVKAFFICNVHMGWLSSSSLRKHIIPAPGWVWTS